MPIPGMVRKNTKPLRVGDIKMTIKAEVFINNRSSGIWHWHTSADFKGWLALMSDNPFVANRYSKGQNVINFPVWEKVSYYQPPIKTADYRVEIQP